MLQNSPSKIEKADITQMAFVLNSVPSMKVHSTTYSSNFLRDKPSAMMSMRPIPHRASKRVIMQNGTLDKISKPVIKSSVKQQNQPLVRLEGKATIAAQFANPEYLSNFESPIDRIDRVGNQYSHLIMGDLDIQMTVQERIPQVYHPDINRAKLERAFHYTGTLTPEIIQQALEQSQAEQKPKMREHMESLTQLEEEIQTAKDIEEGNDVSTINDMMQSQLSQAYKNTNQSDGFQEIYSKYSIGLEEEVLKPFTIAHTEDDGSLNVDQDEATKRIELLGTEMQDVQESEEEQVSFEHKKDLTPDMSTFGQRFMHFLRLTNPRHFFHSSDKIEQYTDVVERIKTLELAYKQQGKGKLRIGEGLMAYVQKANKAVEGAARPCGERLVFKPFRQNSFLPMNTMLMAGILLSPPTQFFQIFWQWTSQTMQAGMNFEYKNPDIKACIKSIAFGYLVTLTGAIGSTLYMRHLLSSVLATAVGSQVLILNTMIAQISSIIGHFLNTALMRKGEIDAGIKVYADPKLKYEVGTCRNAGKKAVLQTIASRLAMSFTVISMPAIMMLGLNSIGIRPMTMVGKKIFELGVIATTLTFAYPLSAAIFRPISKISAEDCEEDLRDHLEEVYFEKGV